jgi:glycosyltransferase involved in cell wall biosynthesis
MRILFDATSVGFRSSGTRTRVLGLAPALARRGFDVAVLTGPGFTEDEVASIRPVVHLLEPRPPRGPLQRRRRQGAMLLAASLAFRPDVVVSECLPWPRTPLTVGVIHDLRWLIEGGPLRRWLHRVAVRQSLRHAQIVHVVSVATAVRLAGALADTEVRVDVVHNGVDATVYRPDPDPGDAAVLARRRLAPGYLLFVGHFEPRKGYELALEIGEELLRRRLSMPLVLVGRGEGLPEEHLAWLKASYPGQEPGRVLRDVTVAELPALYRNARLLLAPSRDEGFGLAPLEALACGRPVIASDIPAHREVLEGAALLVRPDDAEAWIRVMLDILFDGTIVLNLEPGPERARRYTWDAAALAFEASLTRDSGRGRV